MIKENWFLWKENFDVYLCLIFMESISYISKWVAKFIQCYTIYRLYFIKSSYHQQSSYKVMGAMIYSKRFFEDKGLFYATPEFGISWFIPLLPNHLTNEKTIFSAHPSSISSQIKISAIGLSNYRVSFKEEDVA